MKKIILNRKALVTTIAAAFFVVLMFTILAVRIEQNREYAQSLSYKVRCDELSSFLDDITKDLQRATSISGKRAGIYATGFVADNGSVFSNADLALNELILNGSLNGTNVPELQNETLANWTEKITALANQRGFQTNLNVSLFTVNSTPVNSRQFWARVKINGLFMNDSFGYCDFNGTLPRERPWIDGNVSIEGFEDPLYIYKSRGYVARVFVFDNASLGAHDNSDLLISDLLNKRYHDIYDAPSFFERLEGRLASGNDSARHSYYTSKAAQALNDDGVSVTAANATIGMETFVDVGELLNYIPGQVQSSVIQVNQSVVDDVFFGAVNKGELVQNVSALYPWFRIDTAHAATYNISQGHLYE